MEKMNLMLETFHDLENKMIIPGGDFNLMLDSIVEAEGGSLVFKKPVSKLIEKEKDGNRSKFTSSNLVIFYNKEIEKFTL